MSSGLNGPRRRRWALRPAAGTGHSRGGRPRLGLVIGVLLALVATGCSGTSQAQLSTSKPGGTLIYLDAEASSNTQLQGAGTWQDSAYIENITDRLVWKDPATGEIQPHIATSWEISPDGREYRFEIRDGVTYSDGTALDAASVKRNLDWQATGDEAKGIPASTSFPPLTGVRVEGKTVVVGLEQPFADFLDVLSGWTASLVADATIAAPLETQQQITGIVGSGPFVVESEKYGEEIVFAKRAGYAWAPAGLGHTGEAYLDRIVARAVTDDTVRLGALQAGQADLIRYLQPSVEPILAADGFRIYSAQGTGATNQWALKQSVPALRDVRVRQAISRAIDRQEIVADLYSGSWDVATSLVTEGVVGYKDKSAQLVFDPDAAGRLLDAAGYTKRDGDGYRRKDGEQLRLVTVIDVYDSTAKPLYQKIQAQLRDVGIRLELREADYAQVSQAYAAPDVATTRTGWPYPATWVTLRTSWYTEKNNGFKLPEPDPELDRLFDAHGRETDPQQRAQLLGELQDYLVDNAFTIPLIRDSQVFAARPVVNDFGWTAEARPYFYDVWTAEK